MIERCKEAGIEFYHPSPIFCTDNDGSVTIQVYENLGDHNSTAAWYTVDRTTAAGTDADGHKVELLL